MAWLKSSDAAANHPVVLNALEMEDSDDRILNELFGFVWRCATQAAAHEKDYIVTVGTARQLAGSIDRFHTLSKAATFCGYWTEVMVTLDGQERKAFKLVEDEDLFHMILKAERAWAAQRKRDVRDPEKTVPVRLRDGDACRYCTKTVSWKDRVSGRAGSYDHTHPGEEGTAQTMVVACKECNGRRKNDPDSIWKPVPPPTNPLYGPETVAHLAKYGVTVQPTYERIPTTPALPPALADGNQATEESAIVEQLAELAPMDGEATEAVSGPPIDSVQVPGSAVEDVAGDDLVQRSRSRPDQRSPGSSRVGSGRVGTGRVGTGRAGTGVQPTAYGEPADQRLSSPNSSGIPVRPTQGQRNRRRSRPRKRKGKPNV